MGVNCKKNTYVWGEFQSLPRSFNYSKLNPNVQLVIHLKPFVNFRLKLQTAIRISAPRRM